MISVSNRTRAILKAKAHRLALDYAQLVQRVVLKKRVQKRQSRLERPPVPRAVRRHVRLGQVLQGRPRPVVTVPEHVAQLQQLHYALGGELAQLALGRVEREQGEGVEGARSDP